MGVLHRSSYINHRGSTVRSGNVYDRFPRTGFGQGIPSIVFGGVGFGDTAFTVRTKS